MDKMEGQVKMSNGNFEITDLQATGKFKAVFDLERENGDTTCTVKEFDVSDCPSLLSDAFNTETVRCTMGTAIAMAVDKLLDKVLAGNEDEESEEEEDVVVE